MLKAILDLLTRPKPSTQAFKATEPEDTPVVREVVLAGQSITYSVVRTKRRSIGMFIDEGGLRVRAPKRVSFKEIEAALSVRAEWIVEQTTRWRVMAEKIVNDLRPEGTFLLRGARVRLQVTHSFFSSLTQTDKVWQLCFAPQALADEASIAGVVEAELKRLAHLELVSRCEAMLREVGRSAKVSLSDPKAQWGSCARRQGEYHIRLSFRLMQVPPALAFYVIAHEVAHVFEMNHSPRFWAVVAQLDPQYKRHRTLIASYSALLSSKNTT